MPISKMADTQQAAAHSMAEVCCILDRQLDGHKYEISVTTGSYKRPKESLRRHQLSDKVDYTPANDMLTPRLCYDALTVLQLCDKFNHGQTSIYLLDFVTDVQFHFLVSTSSFTSSRHWFINSPLSCNAGVTYLCGARRKCIQANDSDLSPSPASSVVCVCTQA